MSTGYEFDRFYAEVEKRPDGTIYAHVMHESAPGKAFRVGVSYNNESIARLKANGFNNNYETGYDAVSDKFYGAPKQARWEFEKFNRLIEKAAKEIALDDPAHKELERARLQALTKAQATHDQATDMIIDIHNPENETASSMAYEGWGTFGTSSSKNENDQIPTINILKNRSIDPGEYRIRFDPDGMSTFEAIIETPE